MPFSGAGVYTPPAADFPVVTQTVISSTHFNNTINDIATALSTCLTKDGQQTATANIPFGGFRATNVGITAIAGSVGTPAINVSDAATGLYRSAASELAVTVAGTQRARFDGTGLIVTGVGTFSGALSTTTLTASTSVVTPLLTTSGAVNLGLGTNGATQWSMITANGDLIPGDNVSSIGGAATRIKQLFTPIIDSGTTGSLSLKTNNGTTQASIQHIASAVNTLQIMGSPTGTTTTLGIGGEAGTSLTLFVKGNGFYTFTTGATTDAGASGVSQFQVLHTASASRNITATGSNGGNPTIGVTAGSLAITPAVVIAGTSLTIGTSPASTGTFAIPNNGTINARNNANNADLSALAVGPQNGINDLIFIAATSNGVVMKARSGGAAPTTSDLLSGQFAVWRDTGGATTKLYYNNAGAIQSVALA